MKTGNTHAECKNMASTLVYAALLLMTPLLSRLPVTAATGLSIVWPKSVIRGSTTVMWLDGPFGSNVTVYLTAADRVLQETVLSLQGMSRPVELSIPVRYEGQLTLHLTNTNNKSEELLLPVHPLDPIQSLGLRLENTIHQADSIVSIWVACLDHHGLVMKGETNVVQLAVHDPNNIIVQYWSVTLGHQSGLKNVPFRLSSAPQLGTWTVRATAGGLTASQTFQLVATGRSLPTLETNDSDHRPFEGDHTEIPLAQSHFVELSFSERTVSSIEQGAPFAGELTASTSERGVTVGLDVLDLQGAVHHRQLLHFNRTSSIVFTVPPLLNLTTNATLQATLQSIDGQELDNQFVLATHSLAVIARPSENDGEARHPQMCAVQLFSRDGKYRFQEGDVMHLSAYLVGCHRQGTPLFPDNRINYAVTSSSSGHVISWGQEHSVLESPISVSPPSSMATDATTLSDAVHRGRSIVTKNHEERHESTSVTPFNLSIPVTYEMIPRATVTVFFAADSNAGAVPSNSVDVMVDFISEPMIRVVEVKANTVRVNVTTDVNSGSQHCVYGTRQMNKDETDGDTLVMVRGSTGGLETDRFLRLLPKHLDTAASSMPPSPWQIFDSTPLWLVQCFQSSAAGFKELKLEIPPTERRPQLTLLTVDSAGRVRRSIPAPIAVNRPAPWTIDFQLPDHVRAGEELIADVAVTNHFLNCSQTQLQMTLNGGASFVVNGKKYLQQPACLAPGARSVYRVGVNVHDPVRLTLTVHLRGIQSGSCCSPVAENQVVNLDVHQEVLEAVAVSRSVAVRANNFQESLVDSHLFCLGEKIFISNASAFHYETLPLGNPSKTIVFQASAVADVRVFLGGVVGPDGIPNDNDGNVASSSYHLVFGGEDNMFTWIAKQMNGLTEIKMKISTPKLLRQDRLQTFWISWGHQQKLRNKRNNGKQNSNAVPGISGRRYLSVGKGAHVGGRTLLSIPLDIDDKPFQSVGFTTGWGIRGFFRIWGTGGTVTTTRALSLAKPIEASEAKAEVTVKGGLSSMLDNLWSVCGDSEHPKTLVDVLEQFIRRQQRPAGRNDNGGSRPDTNWNRVLQDILRFRLADGSFHNGDGSPDLRLTALTLHALSTIASQSYSDPSLLRSTLSWLHGQQNDDGSFGRDEKNTTTSFILTCLSDVQHDDILLYQLSSAARRFIENQLASANETVATVPLAAAAVLVSHSPAWSAALAALDARYDSMIDCYKSDNRGCLSEMMYALTAYSHQNKPEKVLEMTKSLVSASWDSLHPLEKVRSMKVWSKYGPMFNDPVRNLNVRLTLQNGDVATVFPNPSHPEPATANGTASPSPVPTDDDEPDLNNETVTDLTMVEEHQSVRLHTPKLSYDVPALPQNVELSIAGTGCAILQTRVQWKTSTPPASENSLLSLYTSVEGDFSNTQEAPAALTLLICPGWNGTGSVDLRIRLEMFSSYVVKSVQAEDSRPGVEYTSEVNSNDVFIKVDRVSPRCGRCVRLHAERQHLVRNIQPGKVEVYEQRAPQSGRRWLLHGPAESTVWANNKQHRSERFTMNARPALCT